jgi:prepilin-type N-terminal cleavage/methylation domain-containing protein/prepilin-type processing-associated H-X9-DG protein
MTSPRIHSRRRGFTLIEVLVVVAIIAILIALLLPAVQSARESARRMQCRNNMMNIGLAIQNYHGAHRTLPPGTVDYSGPITTGQNKGYRMSWVAQILPYLDEANVYSKIDFNVPAHDPANATIAAHRIGLLTCSSNPRGNVFCYAGVHHDVEAPIDFDNHGVFFLNSLIRLPEDVPDGLGYTLFVGEMEGSPVWLSGDNRTLRNTGSPPADSSTVAGLQYGVTGSPPPGAETEENADPAAAGANLVGGFNSVHSGGANFALGDGGVRFISSNVDTDLFRRLGHRKDGGLVGAF